jgi:hypothetical protein
MSSIIQLRRSRGWGQPINAFYVGRPTKLGNPHKVGTGHHTVEEAVTKFRKDLIAGLLPFTNDDVRRRQKGKELICWCRLGAPCHDDVLLVVATGGTCSEPPARIPPHALLPRRASPRPFLDQPCLLVGQRSVQRIRLPITARNFPPSVLLATPHDPSPFNF